MKMNIVVPIAVFVALMTTTASVYIGKKFMESKKRTSDIKLIEDVQSIMAEQVQPPVVTKIEEVAN
jgi:hypothetical protein